MRTRHQAAEQNTHADESEPILSSTNRKSPIAMPAKAVDTKASKRTESRSAKGTRKNTGDNQTHLSGTDVEQAPLVDAAGSDVPEIRATSKQAKTANTKGKAASGKSRAGAPKGDNKEQQDKVQPRKRRKGGAVNACKSAEQDVGEGDRAAAKGASVGAEALESNAYLQNAPEETDRRGSAPKLAAEAEEAPQLEAGEVDDEDDAPEEVSMAAGRAGAAAARREERKMAAHQNRLAKEKGRKRAALAEADRDARLAAQQPGPGRTSGAEVLDHEEEEEEDDFLPAAVIEAVKRSREARAADLETDGGQQQPVAAKKLRRRGDPSQAKKLGPFLVQPLSSLPEKKASESAQQFVRQRMFGRGVKRSAEMLIPSTARYYGPSVTF